MKLGAPLFAASVRDEMTEEPKHTPTPWRLSTEFARTIKDAEGYDVALCDLQVTAEFIIRTVNAHEANEKKIAELSETIKRYREAFEKDSEALYRIKRSAKVVLEMADFASKNSFQLSVNALAFSNLKKDIEAQEGKQ